MMVYKDFDTLRFLQNSKDTVLFIGNKIQTSYNSASSHDECAINEQLQQIIQSFTNKTGDKITLNYYVTPSYEGNICAFEISFNNSTYGPNPAGAVNCFQNNAINITVLGKPYCVTKINGGGNNYLYFNDTCGIVKIYVNPNIYERLP
ncbi:MAG: hypothetical protein ACHQK8_05460 [Bacteroidia bacterium]